METFREILDDMMKAARERDARPCRLIYHDTGPADGKYAFYGTWVFEAPYAHPLWHQYVVTLFDLTSPTPAGEPIIYKPGVTHEVICYALNPEFPILSVRLGAKSKDLELQRLEPANFAYQFAAESDMAALKRIDDLVMKFIKKEVSPDTDFSRLHDKLFEDGVSMMNRRPFD